MTNGPISLTVAATVVRLNIALLQEMAAVVEPTSDQLDAINGLEDLFGWAHVEGDIMHSGTMAGSLLGLVGIPPDPTADPWQQLATFANVDPDDFKDEVRRWCMADMEDEAERDGPQNVSVVYRPHLSIPATLVQKGFAKAAHNAARIRMKLTKSREELAVAAADVATARDYDMFLRDKHIEALAQTPPATPAAATAPSLASDTGVKLCAIVDITAEGSVPKISAKLYTDMFKNFIKVVHKPPPEDEEPSIHQMTALMFLLQMMSCYVNLALWGGIP
jgi:hypothetical protein